jgi:signal peptidase II
MKLRNVSLGAVLADQASKAWVVHSLRPGDSVTLLRSFLYITYVQNPGAAFGFMSGARAAVRIPFFLSITLAAGIVVYAYQRFIPPEEALLRFALGLIWGGAAGNFIDRVFYRKVVDFLDVRYHQHQWYVFNVADSCITIGLLLMGWAWWKRRERVGKGGF